MPGDSTGPVGYKETVVFQSTPDINAGRLANPEFFDDDTGRFNPRPTLMPGDSKEIALAELGIAVSIHARH